MLELRARGPRADQGVRPTRWSKFSFQYLVGQQESHLEDQLQPELDLPRRGCSAGDQSRRSVDCAAGEHGSVGSPEIRPIERVEELGSKLERSSLRDHRILD